MLICVAHCHLEPRTLLWPHTDSTHGFTVSPSVLNCAVTELVNISYFPHYYYEINFPPVSLETVNKIRERLKRKKYITSKLLFCSNLGLGESSHHDLPQGM